MPGADKGHVMRTDAKIIMAKRLSQTMTKPEVWLWTRLRARHTDAIIFRRQHPVGRFVLDFYCVPARVAIEVDGEIHTRDHKRSSDAVRDAWLTEQGIYVHRIWAIDLLAAPDDTADAVIALALERLREIKE